jgi:uncharacterized protein
VIPPLSQQKSGETNMATIDIERKATPHGGRYTARIAGVVGEGELTFTQLGPTCISADHTLSPESMRGMGVAKALVERLVADARAEGLKIVPVCSYVKAQALRHPDWADVIEN